MSHAVRWLLILGVLSIGIGSIEAAPPIDFSRDVLPILSDACFQCHGPDEKKREADLRLDDEASVKRMHDNIAAVVPGKSEILFTTFPHDNVVHEDLIHRFGKTTNLPTLLLATICCNCASRA